MVQNDNAFSEEATMTSDAAGGAADAAAPAGSNAAASGRTAGESQQEPAAPFRAAAQPLPDRIAVRIRWDLLKSRGCSRLSSGLRDQLNAFRRGPAPLTAFELTSTTQLPAHLLPLLLRRRPQLPRNNVAQGDGSGTTDVWRLVQHPGGASPPCPQPAAATGCADLEQERAGAGSWPGLRRDRGSPNGGRAGAAVIQSGLPNGRAQALAPFDTASAATATAAAVRRRSAATVAAAEGRRVMTTASPVAAAVAERRGTAAALCSRAVTSPSTRLHSGRGRWTTAGGFPRMHHAACPPATASTAPAPNSVPFAALGGLPVLRSNNAVNGAKPWTNRAGVVRAASTSPAGRGTARFLGSPDLDPDPAALSTAPEPQQQALVRGERRGGGSPRSASAGGGCHHDEAAAAAAAASTAALASPMPPAHTLTATAGNYEVGILPRPFVTRVFVSAAMRRQGLLRLQGTFGTDTGLASALSLGGPPLELTLRDGASGSLVTAHILVCGPVGTSLVAAATASKEEPSSPDLTASKPSDVGGGTGAAPEPGPESVVCRMRGLQEWMQLRGVVEGSRVRVRFAPPASFFLDVEAGADGSQAQAVAAHQAAGCAPEPAAGDLDTWHRARPIRTSCAAPHPPQVHPQAPHRSQEPVAPWGGLEAAPCGTGGRSGASTLSSGAVAQLQGRRTPPHKASEAAAAADPYDAAGGFETSSGPGSCPPLQLEEQERQEGGGGGCEPSGAKVEASRGPSGGQRTCHPPLNLRSRIKAQSRGPAAAAAVRGKRQLAAAVAGAAAAPQTQAPHPQGPVAPSLAAPTAGLHPAPTPPRARYPTHPPHTSGRPGQPLHSTPHQAAKSMARAPGNSPLPPSAPSSSPGSTAAPGPADPISAPDAWGCGARHFPARLCSGGYLRLKADARDAILRDLSPMGASTAATTAAAGPERPLDLLAVEQRRGGRAARCERPALQMVVGARMIVTKAGADLAGVEPLVRSWRMRVGAFLDLVRRPNGRLVLLPPPRPSRPRPGGSGSAVLRQQQQQLASAAGPAAGDASAGVLQAPAPALPGAHPHMAAPAGDHGSVGGSGGTGGLCAASDGPLAQLLHVCHAAGLDKNADAEPAMPPPPAAAAAPAFSGIHVLPEAWCRRSGRLLQLPPAAIAWYFPHLAALKHIDTQPVDGLWAAASCCSSGGGDDASNQADGDTRAEQLIALRGVTLNRPRGSHYSTLDGLQEVLTSWGVANGDLVQLQRRRCGEGAGGAPDRLVLAPMSRPHGVAGVLSREGPYGGGGSGDDALMPAGGTNRMSRSDAKRKLGGAQEDGDEQEDVGELFAGEGIEKPAKKARWRRRSGEAAAEPGDQAGALSAAAPHDGSEHQASAGEAACGRHPSRRAGGDAEGAAPESPSCGSQLQRGTVPGIDCGAAVVAEAALRAKATEPAGTARGGGSKSNARGAKGQGVKARDLPEGHRWRKYGEKDVHGRLRGYFRCALLGCGLRLQAQWCAGEDGVALQYWCRGEYSHPPLLAGPGSCRGLAAQQEQQLLLNEEQDACRGSYEDADLAGDTPHDPGDGPGHRMQPVEALFRVWDWPDAAAVAEAEAEELPSADVDDQGLGQAALV